MLNKDRPLASLFSALGDPIRLAIVERLLAEGETAAGELSAGFDISAPAVSRHLAVLHDAGLIRRRADKQRRLYSAVPDALRDVHGWTDRHRAFWEGGLARLDALMETEKGPPR
ncbi:MAG: helix-turn-helix transcriptional regulator [Rhodobacteraceae bacterium]|nr:helix-turn-helix transcriptional regulator [Paracoccaceae bacterium]